MEYFNKTNKQRILEEIKITILRNGPYYIKTIIRIFVDLFVLFIKFIKHLLKTAYNTFTGRG